MKTLLTAACVIALAAVVSPSLSAQWSPYVAPGAPKTADGKPDLAAAAPRSADGKPDLYSTGKWDGDTLVVETIGFRDDGWLDIVGSPFTDKSKWTERFRRINYGTLEVEITVDNPKADTRPWTVKVNQRLVPDDELIEFVCAEGQKFDQYLRGDFRAKP